MYYYIILNGKKLPTPYNDTADLQAAIAELQERLCSPIISWVIE